MSRVRRAPCRAPGFSTLQRVEIAEIWSGKDTPGGRPWVSVLFNESKLLKLVGVDDIAGHVVEFQYSSTSRNC